MSTQVPSPSVGFIAAPLARYIDVLKAEYDHAVAMLQLANEATAAAAHEADGGDHSNVDDAIESQLIAEHLRNVTWTMLVQARALLAVIP